MTTAQFLAHPLVVLSFGALLTGLLVPAITRGWQDRQKVLEIKAELVGELSEAIMQIMMAVQFSEVRSHLSSEFSEEQRAAYQQALDTAYEQWEVRSAVLGTKLEAYFGTTSLPRDWTGFSEVVTRFYALQGIPKASLAAAEEDVRQKLLALRPGNPPPKPGWLGLRESILLVKAEIIQVVLATPISAFRSALKSPVI